MLRIASGRERVRRGILDDVDLRRWDAEPERERLHDVAKLRLLARPELARLALGEDELVASEVRDQCAAGRYRNGEWQSGDAPAGREILADEIGEHGDKGGEDRDQKERAPAIRGSRVVDGESRGCGVGRHATERLGPR